MAAEAVTLGCRAERLSPELLLIQRVDDHPSRRALNLAWGQHARATWRSRDSTESILAMRHSRLVYRRARSMEGSPRNAIAVARAVFNGSALGRISKGVHGGKGEYQHPSEEVALLKNCPRIAWFPILAPFMWWRVL